MKNDPRRIIRRWFTPLITVLVMIFAAPWIVRLKDWKARRVFDGALAHNAAIVQMPVKLLAFMQSAPWVGSGCGSTLATSNDDEATVFGQCPSAAFIEMKIAGLKDPQSLPRILLFRVWKSGDEPGWPRPPDAEYRGD